MAGRMEVGKDIQEGRQQIIIFEIRPCTLDFSSSNAANIINTRPQQALEEASINWRIISISLRNSKEIGKMVFSTVNLGTRCTRKDSFEPQEPEIKGRTRRRKKML